MCGIAGILTLEPGLDLGQCLTQMRCALLHRGPDGDGQQEIRLTGGLRLGLAHTRLAILDLSEAGKQPMQDPRTGSFIVYNGETYNHCELRKANRSEPFRSTSDTETILRLWREHGRHSVRVMNGMFALAVYDAQRQQLVLTRDRLGIKPLYVGSDGRGTWAFASEIRAILATGLIPTTVSRDALRAYLAFGAVPAPWTLLQRIESLLPAEQWVFDLSLRNSLPEPQRNLYWEPWFTSGGDSQDDRDDLVAELSSKLLYATRSQTQADVPVGVFLSGGIDSSAIVALLAHQGAPLYTFSVGFSDQLYDEEPHARAVAQHFQTHHTTLRIEPEVVLRQYELALRAYDQPSIDGINTYFIAQQVRQAGIKVALSGLGGDELFCGYSSFRRLAWLNIASCRVLLKGIAPLLNLATHSVQTDKLSALLSHWDSYLARYQIIREVMSPYRIQRLTAASNALPRPSLPPALQKTLLDKIVGIDILDAHAWLEISVYMANMLLRDTDQMSMAHALEVRVPLLDHQVLETAFRFPGRVRLQSVGRYRQKPLLLNALPAKLPEAIWRRRKMGFVFPWESWLRQDLLQLTTDMLGDRSAWDLLSLDRVEIQRILSEFIELRPTVRYTDILSLLHLSAWSRNVLGEQSYQSSQLPITTIN